jgi:2-oxoglutarate dehydrogenase E1 component
MGFEYGYSVERPEALVAWEAQFGDFVNGAQTIIDEFLSSAEQKWGQRSSVVLLLPHGYEGQGPDHSSARPERFLQLCAEDNIIVSAPSTPASYFHLLRRQAYLRPRRPLVVLTPKSMLRLRSATSSVAEFTSGTFQPVLGDTGAPEHARRVLVCAGKVYYDLAAERARRGDGSTAIVRVEQFYPLELAALRDELERFPDAEVVWVQEEPANQGAWWFASQHFGPALGGRTLRLVSREASASPSTGSHRTHEHEQAALVEEAFTE